MTTSETMLMHVRELADKYEQLAEAIRAMGKQAREAHTGYHHTGSHGYICLECHRPYPCHELNNIARLEALL